MVSKYNIEFFDVDKGIPSATIADYGITLNPAATSFLSDWKYAKLGLDKEKRIIVVLPHNNDDEATVSITVKERTEEQQYLRINNKDFLRLVAHQCSLSLKPSFRCLAEWDEEENLLLIDLNSILEPKKAARKHK